MYDECPARVISAAHSGGGVRDRRVPEVVAGPDVAPNPGPVERQPHDLRRTLPPRRDGLHIRFCPSYPRYSASQGRTGREFHIKPLVDLIRERTPLDGGFEVADKDAGHRLAGLRGRAAEMRRQDDVREA